VAKQKRPPTPLIDAAQAFDDALHEYGHLAELFLRTPLSTAKQLERINEILQEIAGNEERLGASGKALAEQVAAARDKQQQLAQQMIQRLPEVKQRMEQLRDLLARFEQLGADAGDLNRDAAAASASRDRAVHKELAGRMNGLAERALEVAGVAREMDFEEIATKAHALHQQLLAATKKLEHATL
jgi:hypothetical protein